jgi:hypothetical protein
VNRLLRLRDRLARRAVETMIAFVLTVFAFVALRIAHPSMPLWLMETGLVMGTLALGWLLHRLLGPVWRHYGAFAHAFPARSAAPGLIHAAARDIPNGRRLIDTLAAYTGSARRMVPSTITDLIEDLNALHERVLEAGERR